MSSAIYIDLAADEWGAGTAGASFIAAFTDGRALIARDQAQNPEVRKLLGALEQKLSRPLQREYVSLDQIASARRVGMAGRRGDVKGGMPKHILDLIDEASATRASDIHIEVGEQVSTVFLRVDGQLAIHATWPSEYGLRFIGACYAMADVSNKSFSEALYLAARMAPREGRDNWAFREGLEALRMQFNPIAFGKSYAVFRLLGTTNTATSIEALGYEPDQLSTILRFAARDKGLLIVAGPTGSGKSTSMSSALMHQRDLDARAGRIRALFTVEDPPERRIPGAQQLVVPNTDTDEQRAKAFADAIKAAMRSDPDVIMIGEIRDRTTANLALSASMTGHQVWSTVHCTTAHAIPMRLADLGADRSIIFGSDELEVAIAQRLVPCLCPSCRIPLRKAEARTGGPSIADLLSLVGDEAFAEGPGCDECGGKGVRGRTAIAEVIRTDPDYLEVLSSRGVGAARAFTRDRGELSIADVAILKTQRGDISAFEIARLQDVPRASTPDLRAVSA